MSENAIGSESILNSIKKLIGGISEDCDVFDADIMTHINSAFLDLNQIGIGPEEGYTIAGKENTWSEFETNELILGSVKTFVYIKVKLVFDPPTNSFVVDSLNKMLDKIEWRLNMVHEQKIAEEDKSNV